MFVSGSPRSGVAFPPATCSSKPRKGSAKCLGWLKFATSFMLSTRSILGPNGSCPCRFDVLWPSPCSARRRRLSNRSRAGPTTAPLEHHKKFFGGPQYPVRRRRPRMRILKQQAQVLR